MSVHPDWEMWSFLGLWPTIPQWSTLFLCNHYIHPTRQCNHNLQLLSVVNERRVQAHFARIKLGYLSFLGGSETGAHSCFLQVLQRAVKSLVSAVCAKYLIKWQCLQSEVSSVQCCLFVPMVIVSHGQGLVWFVQAQHFPITNTPLAPTG